MSIREQFAAGEGLVGLTVIDAHAHVGPWTSFYTPDPGIPRMIDEMDRMGVDICCVSSLLAIAVDTTAGNEEVARAIAAAPGRLVGYVTLNPHAPLDENRRELERRFRHQHGFIGVKLHPMWHACPVDGPLYEPLWDLAGEYTGLVLGHSWLGSEEPEGHGAPERYAAMARRYPSLTVILGHGGGTRAGQEASARLCTDADNLYLDICAGEFGGLWLEDLLRLAPPDKVLFASDMPFLGLGSPLGRVAYSGIGDEIKRLILGQTMKRLLHLPDQQ